HPRLTRYSTPSLHDALPICFLHDFNGRSLFVAETAGRREALLDLLGRIDIKPTQVDSWPQFANSDVGCAIMIAPVDQGLLSNQPDRKSTRLNSSHVKISYAV